MSDEAIVISPEEKIEVEEKKSEPFELVHLVATNTQQMAASQSQLAIWLKNKESEIQADIDELTIARSQAKARRWGTATFSSQLSKAEKRKMFYSKLLMAVEAGYTVIPNLPIDLLAIRVKYSDQPSDTSRHSWTGRTPPTNIVAEKSDVLPVGVGEYVSPLPNVSRSTSIGTDNQGNRETTYHLRATSLKEMEFPVTVAVPEIMDATSHAMALKIFDQIGICPAKGMRPDSYRTTSMPPVKDPDPLIIGQILTSPSGYSGRKPISFLIAWHLDLRTL